MKESWSRGSTADEWGGPCALLALIPRSGASSLVMRCLRGRSVGFGNFGSHFSRFISALHTHTLVDTVPSENYD